MAWPIIGAIASLFAGGDTAKAATKVLDAGIAGVDKLFYTDEEKAEARARMGDAWLKLQEMMGEETTARAMTRRILAVGIVGAFIGLILASGGIYGLGYFHPFFIEWANHLYDLATTNFDMLTLMVATFYYGPYMVGQAINVWKGKKGKEGEDEQAKQAGS